MIDTRFTWTVGVLLSLALVPILRHSYGETYIDDGRRTARIPERLAGAPGVPTPRDAGWVRRRFYADDWMERRYFVGGRDVTLFAARSRDLKRLYHHPELAVAIGFSLRSAGEHRIAALPQVPVHVLRGSSESGQGLAAYVLEYGERFVGDPYWFQLRLAGPLLISARQPMTLLFAFDERAVPTTPLEEEPAMDVLVDAINGFAAQRAPVESFGLSGAHP
jgi:hypothetical protein